MTKRKFRLSRRIYFLILLLLAVCITLGVVTKVSAPESPTRSEQPEPASHTEKFNKTMYPLDQPDSPWWIVNKNRPLPSGYVPADLTVPNVSLRLVASSEQMKVSATVAPNIEHLFSAASTAGYPLTFASGYRSEAYQRQLYEGYIKRDGQAAADRYSARPGTSEHQTGLAFDVCVTGTSCELTQAFGDTEAGKWVAANAHHYGFIIHYAKGKEAITGYDYEPWHLRFVGNELAQQLQKNGLALEEFFGL